MDIGAARDLALAMPEAEERDHFGNPSYRARGKGGRIFMTQQLEAGTAVLMLTVDQQVELISHRSEAFMPHPSKWGEKGATLVRLDRVSPVVFKKALDAAWSNARPQKPGRQRGS